MLEQSLANNSQIYSLQDESPFNCGRLKLRRAEKSLAQEPQQHGDLD